MVANSVRNGSNSNRDRAIATVAGATIKTVAFAGEVAIAVAVAVIEVMVAAVLASEATVVVILV